MSTTPRIEINTSDDFEPSERLRAAIERVAAASQDAQRADDTEVEGFGSRLQIGSLGVSAEAGVSHWRNGCWGFQQGPGGGCNWFTSDDEVPPVNCIGHSWGSK